MRVINIMSELNIEEIINTRYSDKSNYTKDFIRQAIERYGDIYDYYKTNRVDNNLTKVIVTCRIHGDFEICPQYFLKSKYCYGCPQCHPGKSTKLTLKRFSEKLVEVFPYYSLTPNSKYVNNSTPIELHCNKHDEIFTSRPHNLLWGKCGCQKCNFEKKSEIAREEGEKQFQEWLNNNFPQYTQKSSYLGSDKVITLHCENHNLDFTTRPNSVYRNFSSGSSPCPECQKELHQKWNREHFVKRVTEIFGKDRYDLSKINYITNISPVSGIICNVCGGEVSPVLPGNFLKRGRGCACYQSKSRGEVEIGKWLKENNFEFTEQYKVEEDLKVLSGRTENSRVIIDFRLFIEGKEYWIECSGEQHYTWIQLMHTREEFENQLRRDKNVREYCKTKGITLIEIPIHKIGTGVKLYNILKSIFIDKVEVKIPIPEISYTRVKHE